MSKTRVMLFFPHLNKIGGVESCFLNFCKRFNKIYDITIGYDVESDKDMIKQLSKYAKVEKQDVFIETDVFIQGTMYPTGAHFIECKKKGLWVHCIPFIYPNSIIENKEFMQDIDFIVCVSDYCTKLVQDYGYKQAITIHNDFNVEEIRELANAYETPKYDYCYVGRLSTEKGMHRIPKLARKDREKKIVIVGCPYEQNELMDMMLDQPNIIRVGAKENPYPYMKNSKFTILLSNFESWGNVITESLIIGTPVITTDFDTAKEQIQDGVNGYILNMDMKNIDKIKPLKIEQLDYKCNWEKWIEIIGE
jgi:glycosyltransferase involved in cell wall biosynthesis